MTGREDHDHRGGVGESDLVDLLAELRHELNALNSHRQPVWKLPGFALELVDNGHGSGASLFKTRGSEPLFIKHQPQIARNEYRGFDALSRSTDFREHLMFPLLEGGDDDFWVTSFFESENLHELACMFDTNPDVESTTREVFTDFLRKDALLWHQTQAEVVVDLQSLYWQRLYFPDRMATLQRIVNQKAHNLELHDVELVVNGIRYGRTRDILDDVFDRLQRLTAPRGCVVHGDDQPRNIIVPLEANKRSSRNWFVVDYVTAHENGDWMIAAAKLFHWWDFYCVVDMALDHKSLMDLVMPNMVAHIDENRLEISYDNEALEWAVPNVVKEMREELLVFVSSNSKTLEADPQAWNERFRLALFAVVFGSAHRHTDSLAFALPLMIGKSLEYLNGDAGNW